MKREYHLYYNDKVGNKCVVYSSETKQISTMSQSAWYKLYHKFKLLKGYEMDEKGLLKYAADFATWVKEIKSSPIKLAPKSFKTFDPLFYNSLNEISKGLFRIIGKGKYEHHEPITDIERKYMDDCPNSGLMYCDESISEKYIKSYSYDYTFDYPKCMAADKLKIPSKAGKEYKLNVLPEVKDIKTGYYRIKITCENKEFRKLFTFSKKHTYADRSVIQAIKYKDEYNVKIELNQDLNYNCYLYDDECLESGKKIFGKWYEYILGLKEKFPKNGLVKFIGSSLHGQISQRTYLTKSDDQVYEEILDIGVLPKNRYFVKEISFFGEIQKYKLIDTKKPSEFDIRLKSFLTAYVRNKTARLVTGHLYFGKDIIKNVEHNLQNIIRVHTDSVTFTKEMKHLDDVPDLKLEKKSTGLIKWLRVGKYHNKTTGEYHGRWNDANRYDEEELDD